MLERNSAMLKLWVLCGVLCCVLTLVFCSDDMGTGVWKVNYITKCGTDQHKIKFDIIQKKLNRTHDCFEAGFKLEETFDESYAILIDMCKYMDGGCKQYQVLSDNCFVNFAYKYAENNVKTCLEKAGIDPPKFPIAAGEYKVDDYIFDYTELPSDGIYGTFCAKAYILKGTEKVGCVELHVEFRKVQEEDDDDCDEE